MKAANLTKAIILLLCLGSSLLGDESTVDNLTSQELSQCIDVSEGNDHDMRACLAAETEKWDGRLNEAYQKLQNLMPPNAFSHVKQGQIHWIQYKQKTCDYAFASQGGGTASFVVANNCILNLTIPRTLELEELVRFWQPPPWKE